MSEKDIMLDIQKRASKLGMRLWRNNVGTYQTKDGSWIRYGLQNPGGSDLIGWTPVKISDSMVGKTLPVFTAIEVKTETGKASDEQLNFIKRITENGGPAGICRSPDELNGLVSMYLREQIQGRSTVQDTPLSEVQVKRNEKDSDSEES